MKAFRTFLRSLLLMGTLCLLIPQTSATHFMGLDMYYECLPGSTNCVYRIYSNIYYDCGSAATLPPPNIPFPPSLQAFQPDTCIQPIAVGNWTYVHYIEVAPICATVSTMCTNPNSVINGVLEGRFYRDYNFCNTNCSTYNIVWGSCCRNGTIIGGPANAGIYSGTTSINLGLGSCNNSPYFATPCPTYICSGIGAVIDQHAIDPDGDSLAYKLVNCAADSANLVTYLTGFSPTQPMGPSWDVTLDPHTGALAFLPNPGNLVASVLCIMVEEYRNGVKIGSILRDVQLTSVMCPGNNGLPDLDGAQWVSGGAQTDSLDFEICINDTLSLNLYFSNPNPAQIITLDTSNLIPGLQLANTIGNPLITSMKFAPGQVGDYAIPFSLQDGQCPIIGQNIVYVNVKVTSNCISSVITHAPCNQAVGAIDVSVTGGNFPFTYSWSTGDTTQDISGLLPGAYTVTITDSLGNMQTRTWYVNASNMNLNDTLAYPTCNNLSGSITTNPAGGIPPYSYLWSTGDTTAAIINLSPGGYSVTVQDVNGCKIHQAFILDPPDSCFNIIEGTVFEDVNGNCVQDVGEMPIPNTLIDISPGGAVMTDANGVYQYIVTQGSFSVRVQPNAWQQVICPANGFYPVTFVNLGDRRSNRDFAVQTDSVQDLRVHSFSAAVRPGFSASHTITVFNNGSHPASGTLTWEHDSILQYQSATPTPWSYQAASNTVTWNFFNLQPFQSETYTVYTSTDSSLAIGTLFLNEAIVNPILGDSVPADNVSIFQSRTVGATDPNDKLVTPIGDGPRGLIEQNEERLTYTVRFQNTGTDTAFYVVIRDTVDANLKPLSFQKMGESHPYQLTIEGDKILVFRFDHINLPDSAADYQGSQGYVAFSLEIDDMLPPGTQITNEAAIYFDFNAPVITNSTLNTVFTYPEVDLGPDLQICAGDEIQAMITSPGLPPYDFQWSHGVSDTKNLTGISQAAVTATGSYFVTVTDSLGISATSPPIHVAVTQLPNASFTFSAVGLSVAFINTGSFSPSLQWDFGDGDTLAGALSHIHTYEKGELYTVTLIITNGCGSDTITQDVDLRGVGIGDARFVQSIELVPHPVQDVSYLRFANAERAEYRLRVLDLQGRVVKELPETRGDVFEISRAELAAGLYLYELRGSHSYFGKMVVK